MVVVAGIVRKTVIFKLTNIAIIAAAPSIEPLACWKSLIHTVVATTGAWVVGRPIQKVYILIVAPFEVATSIRATATAMESDPVSFRFR